MTEPTTCGTCQHWRKLPADPKNLSRRWGTCLVHPPQIVKAVTDDLGRVMSQTSAYPVLQAEFPACSLHQPVEEAAITTLGDKA